MPMNASSFPIIGTLQDGCWAVKLSMIWQLLWQPREKDIDQLLSAKRDSPGSVPLPQWYQEDGQHWIRLQSKKEDMEGMVWSWIDLILFGCSGNQATVLLEALVLMANLVDLMVGSIQLGLVSERGGEAFSFEVIY